MRRHNASVIGEVQLIDGTWHEVASVSRELVDMGPGGDLPMVFATFPDGSISIFRDGAVLGYRSRPEEDAFPEKTHGQVATGLPTPISAHQPSSTFGPGAPAWAGVDPAIR